jgi:phosphoribosylanthranilate isomerase
MIVKICGNTNIEDALFAAQNGADFLGLIVEFPPSPRHVSLQEARQISDALQGSSAQIVAVTVNLSLPQLLHLRDELSPAVFQLHGDESPELVSALKAEGAGVWTAVHTRERALQMRAAGADALLIDARATSDEQIIYGGTGQRSDWILAKSLVEEGARVVLAGGLTPENVGAAIEWVQPWAVDTVSGVEAQKGRKDSEKVRRFITAAKAR